MNKPLPKVCVLLAAYNGSRWIQQQITSILTQEDVAVEIYVSVDRSRDLTLNIIKELAQENKNLHVLPYGEVFGGAGKNFYRLFKDVDFQDFDAVALSDQDDIWFRRKLKRACSKILFGEFECYSSNVIAFWPDGKRKCIRKSQRQRKLDYLFEAAGPGCTYVLSCNAALEFKRFLELSEGVKEIELHDWLAYAFCRHNGFNWYIDAEPTMLYRQHELNQVGVNQGLKAYVRRVRLVKNHWYREQVNRITSQVAPKIVGMIRKESFLLRNIAELRRSKRDRFVLFIFILLRIF